MEKMMSDGLVLFERDGPIATLTLNRPDKRHVLNLALWTELGRRLATIEQAGEAIGVVMVRAAGAVFCAGNALAAGVAHEVLHSAGVGPDFADRVAGRFGK